MPPLCPRLVAWREAVAADPPRRHQGETLLGAPAARVRRPGRARCWWSAWRPPPTAATGRGASSPATARGTGCSRPCTGPATRTSPRRRIRGDGLRLPGAYIAAVVRCAPPANRPTPAERDTCLPYLVRELRAARRDARVIVALGSFAWDGALRGAARRRRRGAAPEAAVRSRGGGAGRPLHAARLLPPQPAEHVHRQAHRADDGRRASRGRGLSDSDRLAGVKELAPGLHMLSGFPPDGVQRLLPRDRRGRGGDRHGHAPRAAADPAPARGARPGGDLHHPRPPRPRRVDARRRRERRRAGVVVGGGRRRARGQGAGADCRTRTASWTTSSTACSRAGGRTIIRSRAA